MSMRKGLLPVLTFTMVLIFGISLSPDAYSGATSFKVESNKEQPKRDYRHKYHRYDRNYYGHRDSYKRYKERKYRHYYDDDRRYRHKDFIYVLPKGSRIVIINGHRYHRWQDKYYLSGYYKGDKVFIAVDL